MHAPAGDKPNFLCVYCGKSFESYSGELSMINELSGPSTYWYNSTHWKCCLIDIHETWHPESSTQTPQVHSNRFPPWCFASSLVKVRCPGFHRRACIDALLPSSGEKNRRAVVVQLMSACISLWISCTTSNKWPNLFFIPLLGCYRTLCLSRIVRPASTIRICPSRFPWHTWYVGTPQVPNTPFQHF